MISSSKPVLQIDNLTVSYRQGNQWLDAVRDVDLQIEAGQTYGLVGESGSGKSTLALAIMSYLSENGAIRQGTIELAGRDLLAVSDAQQRQIWREQIKLVPQNPLSSLNPSLRIGPQLIESLPDSVSAGEAQGRVLALLEMVRMADPQRVAQSYPHQLSGGMQQRVMIAMALSSNPVLLVLDEPTTNLDVTTEAVILDLVSDLTRERNTAVLFVSHNLGLVARICDRVAVLYAGELVEDAALVDLYRRPLHPYTQGLLDSVPRLGQNKRRLKLVPIPGQIPALDNLPAGCVFAPRCPLATEICKQERPPLERSDETRQARCHRWPEILQGKVGTRIMPADSGNGIEKQQITSVNGNGVVLQVTGLQKQFALRRSLLEMFKREPIRQVRAVDGIDVQAKRGRTLGLVGESGSGKTTLVRCIIGLEARSDGQTKLLDIPLSRNLSQRDQDVLRRLQMVFQNPEEALNPYRTVGDTLRRTLIRLTNYGRREADEAVTKLLAAVNLSPGYANRIPHQLSGGEKQRVAIARAFASKPDLLLFDEAVSALDVSVQASILNLLNQLQQENQSAYLFISHDLSVVSYLADDIAVVYLGHLMEVGPTPEIMQPPYHPYTEALLSAVPSTDLDIQQERIRLTSDIPSPVNIPGGCRFHTRCPRCLGDICVDHEPPWQVGENGHRIYCHIPLDELSEMQSPLFEIKETH